MIVYIAICVLSAYSTTAMASRSTTTVMPSSGLTNRLGVVPVTSGERRTAAISAGVEGEEKRQQNLQVHGYGRKKDSVTEEKRQQNLRALAELNLSGNALEYGLSPRLVFSGALQVLDLSSNRLSSPIPRWIAGAPEKSGLILLDLSRNLFSGEIPEEIVDLKSLLGIFLSNNQLSGEIPHAIGNLTYLQILDLSHNYSLSGSIPSRLGACFQLWQLKLDHNS